MMTRCSMTTPHSHPSNLSSVEAAKLKSSLKERFELSRTKPAQLLADTLAGASTEVGVALGKKESVKRTIRNNQNKSLHPNPKTVGECIIEGDWCLTEGDDKKQFPIYDSGPDSSNRVVVFGTKDCLEHLSNSSVWFMDGTFSSAPSIFTQVYLIRAPIGESAITCVYALVRNKQQSSYEEMFIAVLNTSEEYGYFQDPQVIVTDFEQAVLNAIQVTFGESGRRQGGFYHLSQSTYRQIQNLGLVALYKENEYIKHWCGILDALAFLPIEDVSVDMEWVKENAPEELCDLVTYFDSTYVSDGYWKVSSRNYKKVSSRNNNEGGIPSVRVRKLPPLYAPDI